MAPQKEKAAKGKATARGKPKPVSAVQLPVLSPTVKKKPNSQSFKPGKSGNPAGRPKGSRAKLGEAFIADMCKLWEVHGADLIARAVADDAVGVLRILASLLPKEVTGEGGGPLKLVLVQGDTAL